MQSSATAHFPIWIAGIAVAVICLLGIASMAVSALGVDVPLATSESDEAAPALAIVSHSGRSYRCAECGVIVSAREVDVAENAIDKIALNVSTAKAAGDAGLNGKPVRNYQITIRLQDGSMRVITDSEPSRWRTGERVKLIAGVDDSGR